MKGHNHNLMIYFDNYPYEKENDISKEHAFSVKNLMRQSLLSVSAIDEVIESNRSNKTMFNIQVFTEFLKFCYKRVEYLNL
jgi:hypothetical protein